MHLITRELLYLCLDNGGDPNLPTTDAARTVFHLALVAPVPDYQLIQVNFNWGLEKLYFVVSLNKSYHFKLSGCFNSFEEVGGEIV